MDAAGEPDQEERKDVFFRRVLPMERHLVSSVNASVPFDGRSFIAQN